MERQSRDFVEQGGFSERLYAARKKERSVRSDALNESAPACPLCGEPMCRRTARKGANAGKMFWGCSAYPECKGIVNVSDKSDPSDAKGE